MALVNPGIALSVENFKVPNMLGMASEAESIQNKQVTRQAAQQEMERAQYAQAVQKSRDALSYISTPEQYLAWHEANHKDPVLGSMLSKMGVSADQSRGKIMAELQKPGGFERLIQQSAAGADKLSSIMSERLNTMAAERKAAQAANVKAAQQAEVDKLMGRSGAATPATASTTAPVTTSTTVPDAPVAQAFPVAPPVDTGVYEPGTTGAINQMYAQSRAGQTRALNALTVAPPTPSAAAPATAPSAPATTPSPAMSPAMSPSAIQTEIATLANTADQLYAQRNPTADAEAKRIEARIKLLRDQLPKGALVNINMPQEEKSFEEKVGKEGVKRAYDNFEAAREASDIVATVETGRDLLNSGMITGAGAEFFVGLNQALKTAGVDFGYADASANSQAYAANMAQNVGKIIKQFGAGTGLSDADRQYAEKMAAGKISLDAQALRKILRINEDAARRGIQTHNKLMTDMGAPDYLRAAEPPFNTARVPPAAIEYLRANPKTKSDFDKMYGYGYADFILGGQNGR